MALSDDVVLRRVSAALQLGADAMTPGESDAALEGVARLIKRNKRAITEVTDTPKVQIIDRTVEIEQAVRDKHQLARRVDELAFQLEEKNLAIHKSNDKIKELIDQNKKLNMILLWMTVIYHPDGDLPIMLAERDKIIAARDEEIIKLKAVDKPTQLDSEPSSVPPLGSLDRPIEKAPDRLVQLLYEMTDLSADDKEEKIGVPKFAVGVWYQYRRGGRTLPDLSPKQLEAAVLMDAIYLSQTHHNVGRKAVQDILNNRWWKIVYPHAKVALQGETDPTISKISWNTIPS